MRPHVPTMRRSIIPLSLLLAVAAATCVLGLTGSAGAAPRSALIVCPQSAGQTPPTCCPLPPRSGAGQRPAVVTCCPPPAAGTGQRQAQPICCGTAPCCTTACCTTTCCTSTPCGPGSLTIAASPNPSRAGQKVVISGAVAGTPAAGAQVVLWRKLARQSIFRPAGQTTTDSAGDYTFTLKRGKVMADQEWYVTSNGTQSATVQQRVDALVGLVSSSPSPAVGQAIVLRGHVTPSHAGQAVLLEMSRGGAWHVIARPRLGRGSSFAMSHRFARSGAVEFRVVLNADHRNERSISRTVTVKVKM